MLEALAPDLWIVVLCRVLEIPETVVDLQVVYDELAAGFLDSPKLQQPGSVTKSFDRVLFDTQHGRVHEVDQKLECSDGEFWIGECDAAGLLCRW